jgi:tetratricopeptide (TPR) repeat protein
MTRATAFLLTAAVATLAMDCGSRPDLPRSESASPAAAPADEPRSMPNPTLPDLSGSAASIERQLRDQYAALLKEAGGSTAGTSRAGAAYGRMGSMLMAAEYRQAAAPFLLNAQALDGREVRWPYYLAHLYRADGETAKSASFFEQARDIQPENEAIQIWLATAYLDLNRLEDAEQSFERARAQHPASAAAVSGLGRTALARQAYEQAAKYFEQALSLDPQATLLHYHLALAYRGLGRLDEATTQLRRKGDRDVQFGDPLLDELSTAIESGYSHEHLGTEAMNRRDYAAAIAQFRRGLELAPDDASLRQRLGTALSLSGDNRAAAAEFEEVLRRTPDHAATHYALGVLHVANHRLAEGMAHFAAALKSNPSYAEARLQLADALRRSGRPQESLPQFAQTIELDPRLADAPLGYAMALVSLKRYREARDQLSAASARFPERAAIAHALVRLLAAAPDGSVRDGQRAVGLAEMLLAREPPSPDLGEVVAMAMAEAGRFDEAVLWQQRGIGLADQTQRPAAAKRMTATLEMFADRQPSRSPWRDDDPLGGDVATPF